MQRQCKERNSTVRVETRDKPKTNRGNKTLWKWHKYAKLCQNQLGSKKKIDE